MAFSLAPTFGIGYQAFDRNGKPLNGGLLYTYISGGTAELATYVDSTGLTANANPIVLAADGRPPSEIWLTVGYRYRFVLKDSADDLIASWDDVPSTSSLVTGGPLPPGSGGPTSSTISSGGPLDQSTLTPILVFTVQPSNVSQGSVMSPAVVVSAQYGNGVVVSDFTGNVTLAMGAGSSVLGGTTTVAAVAGVATFSDLTLSLEENSDTLVATSTGFTSATSSAFNVTAAVYSATAVTTYTGLTRQAVGADAQRYLAGYTGYLTLYDTADLTNIYRVNASTGVESAQTCAGTPYRLVSVDSDGNLFYQMSSGADIHYLNTSGTDAYFTVSAVAWSFILPTVAGTLTTVLAYNGTPTTTKYSAINYTAHSATTDSVSSPGEFAKQNYNIAAGKFYCCSSGAVGYADTSTNAFVSLVASGSFSAIDQTCLLVDSSENLYVLDGAIIKKFDSAGNAGATYTMSGGTGTYKLSCIDSLGYLWARNVSPTSTKWWKVKISDMSLKTNGTLNLHNTSLAWDFAIGCLWGDTYRPILFTSDSTTFYIGEMAYA